MSSYVAVVGLEVHAQLNTNSKLFCSCKREFGAKANKNVCPICLGMPGTLPVPNERAVELAVRLGLALNCTIDRSPMWTRKNYFYPDLPKGYQITQQGGMPVYDRPICKDGHLDIEIDGKTKRIGITRIHMEEDAGKLIHDLDEKSTHFDANRCGTPLCEIVSEPDIRTPREAYLYLQKLKQILEYTGVSDANMEKGNMRCDANLSIRESEGAPFGTRTEVKNLNSMSNVEKALASEFELQCVTVDAGRKINQCTKRFDVNTGKTYELRSKEDAHDYRYFPEPDMVRLCIDDKQIEAARQKLPELPDAVRARFVSDYGLSAYDAAVLALERDTALYFDQVASTCQDRKLASNWLSTELLREVKEIDGGVSASKIKPTQLADLVNLISVNTISGKIGKTIFAEMWKTGKDPADILKEQDLGQISDTEAIEALVREVAENNPAQAEEFKAGKDKLMGFFVGQVMKQSRGKANPAMVNEMIRKILRS